MQAHRAPEQNDVVRPRRDGERAALLRRLRGLLLSCGVLVVWIASCKAGGGPPSQAPGSGPPGSGLQPVACANDAQKHVIAVGQETPLPPKTFFCKYLCEPNWEDCNGDLKTAGGPLASGGLAPLGDGCETPVNEQNCGCGVVCPANVKCVPTQNGCDKLGASCIAEEPYFCGTPLNCGSGTNTCCPMRGDTSIDCRAPNVHCCPGDICDAQGVCRACVDKGGACTDSSQCCPAPTVFPVDKPRPTPLVCTPLGQCGPPCHAQGDTCSSESDCCQAPGKPLVCQGGGGTLRAPSRCEPACIATGAACTADSDCCQSPSKQTCHAGACTPTAKPPACVAGTLCGKKTPAGCQAGFSLQFVTQCVDGVAKCVPPPFCGQGTGGTGCDGYAGGKYCGHCGGSSCCTHGINTPTAPNCCPSGDATCVDGTPLCTPGYACGGGAENTPAQCIGTGCQNLSCWLPSDLKLGTTCPTNP